MSKGETATEPSMDEILSSIRKIIAEDEVDEAEPTASSRADAGEATAGEADDDILELTEDDEITVEPDFAADVAEDGEDETADAPVSDPEKAVASLLEENRPEPETAPLEHSPAMAEAASSPAAVPADEGPGRPAAIDEAAVTTNAITEMLLDSGTATAASGALQRLSAAMSPAAAIPAGDRTIEAFLADLVRPELKAWLDQHLPQLVERIVEREIKRLVRDAQPE